MRLVLYCLLLATVVCVCSPAAAQYTIYDCHYYGAVGDGQSHPLSNYYATLAAAQAVYPTATALTNEIDGLAMQKGLTAVKRLNVPVGTYLTNTLINLGGNGCSLVGNNTYSTIIRATAALPGNDAMITVSSSGLVQDLFIDGNNVSAWGVKLNGNKVTLERLRVMNQTQAGIVYDSTQNSLTSDCQVKYNLVNLAIYNGTYNCKWVNCNTEVPATQTDPNSRQLLLKNLADARLASYTGGGPRGLSFFGGIYERGNADFQVEIVTAQGFIQFSGVELCGMNNGTSEKAIVKVRSTFTGQLLFECCAFAGAPEYKNIQTAGAVKLDRCVFTGDGPELNNRIVVEAGGSVEYGDESLTGRRNLLEGNSARFVGGLGNWVGSNGGTVTWNATTSRLVMTGATTAQGGKISIPILASESSAGRLVRIEFYLDNVTPSTNNLFIIKTVGKDSPWTRRTIATVGPGPSILWYKCQGGEGAIEVTSGQNSTTSWELAYCVVNVF
jgi:hypothetical protein